MYLIFFHLNGDIYLKQQNQDDLNKMTINCAQKGSEFNATDPARTRIHNILYSFLPLSSEGFSTPLVFCRAVLSGQR